MTEQRRLAAIVSADVAGYSRLMGRDESGTLASLKAIRLEVVDPAITRHGGRIVKTTGDGLLLEFPSVVNAMRCAIELQTDVAAKVAKVPEDQRITFRIGVNLGDVIVDGDDIFGDGVNIAARLEVLAEPGGICVSDDAFHQVRGKIDVLFVEMGPQSLKNIDQPVHAWCWSPSRPSVAPATPPSLALPDKPSIAVLPFENMSGDPEQEYFADGVVEDIITALSRFKSLFVIARNSSFTYKGSAVDIKQVGRELGVRYVLEGSIRKMNTRVRVTAQLIDASSGSHLWADRYDRDLVDLFEVQDEITTRVATAVDPAIRNFETRAALRKQVTDLGAWDHFLRGLWQAGHFKKESNAEARREFEEAIKRNPSYALAIAWKAMTHTFDAWFNWTKDHAGSLSLAQQASALAIRLDDSEPQAFTAAGFVGFWSGRLDMARTHLEQALALNPNSCLANYCYAVTLNYLGEGEKGLPYGLKALDLSPNDPLVWNCFGGVAHIYLNLKRYSEAIALADRGIARRHGYLFARVVRTSALAHADQLDEAREAAAEIRKIDPQFSLSRMDHYPFRQKEKEHLFGGLIAAGLST
jgi:adenylate cyclase